MAQSAPTPAGRPPLHGVPGPWVPRPRSSSSSNYYPKHLVRAGYWNRRGDHLYVTDKGKRFIMYAPHDLANPQELKTYPSSTEEWRNHRGDLIKYDGSVLEPLDCLPGQGRSPLRPCSSVSAAFVAFLRRTIFFEANRAKPRLLVAFDRDLKPNSVIVVSWRPRIAYGLKSCRLRLSPTLRFVLALSTIYKCATYLLRG